MKKLVILILLSLFVLVGCQDDNSILAPNNDYASDELTKGRPILGLDGDNSYNLTDGLDEAADSTKLVNAELTTIIDETTGEKLSK